MSPRRVVLVLLCCVGYLGGGYLSSGCIDPVSENACSTATDCGAGYACIGSECKEASCTADDDVTVPNGMQCDEASGKVVEPTIQGNCPEGQIVEQRPGGGECKPPAQSDADCELDEQEVGGQCTEAPCRLQPWDSCPEGFVCNDVTGGCEAGVKVAGPIPNPTNEVSHTASGEIRERCPTGGPCPQHQQCDVAEGYCVPIPCTSEGNECFGLGNVVCDEETSICKPVCGDGCPPADTCDSRTGVCIGNSSFDISLPASFQTFAIEGEVDVAVQVPTLAGDTQIHSAEITLPDGLTFSDFTVEAPEVFADQVQIPAQVVDATTMYLITDPTPGAPVQEFPLLRKRSDVKADLICPEGCDGVAAGRESGADVTFQIVVPVQSPGSGIFCWEVLATGVDWNTGGRRDAQTPDPATAFETYCVDVSPDPDGDLLSTSLEVQIYGTDPNNPDTDGDGFPDGFEVDAGSLPTDRIEVPYAGVRDTYKKTTLWGGNGADNTTTPPALFDVDAAEGLVQGVVWAIPTFDRIVTAQIVNGVPQPAVTAYEAIDVPPACGGFDAFSSVDGLGPDIVVTATCTADGQTRVLRGSLDGTAPLTIAMQPGDLLGTETVTTIADATFAGTPGDADLVILGTGSGGGFIARSPAPFVSITKRAGPADVGVPDFDLGQVEADDGFIYAKDSTQTRLLRFDRAGPGATGASIIVDASAGAPSPLDSTETIASFESFSVGGDRLGAEFATSDGRSGLASWTRDGDFVEMIWEVDTPIPGSTPGGTSPGLRDPDGLAIFGDRAAFNGRDQLSTYGTYGHVDREDGSRGTVQKLLRVDDSLGAETATLLDSAVGGRMSLTITSPRAMLGQRLVARTLAIDPVVDYDIVLLEPGGPPVPRAVLLALRPAGSGTNRYRFSTSPPIFVFEETLGQGSLSGAARSPTTGAVRISQGFNGTTDPAVGGNIWSYGTGAGPLAFVGQTTSLTATPGLAFDATGALFATASTDSGSADTLASIDVATGADTLIGGLFVAPSTPVDSADALALDPLTGALWVFASSAGGLAEVDRTTGELTVIGELPGAFANLAGASVSLDGEVFVSAGGSGGGWIAHIDRAPLAGPPGTPALPLRVLSDVQILNQSISDIIVVDSDGDGIDDVDEAGFGTSPTNPDSDGDGLGDGAEALNLLTDPNVADTDGDGLDDGEERLVHRTNVYVADTDGDGFDDGTEVQLGTDPLDASSFPSTPLPTLERPTLALLVVLMVMGGVMWLPRRRRSS